MKKLGASGGQERNGGATVIEPAQGVECSNGAVYLSASHVELYSFDDKYMERLQGKDPATEDHFYDYFGTLLRITLRSRKLPADAIKEIQQETFSRVLEAVHKGEVRQPECLGAFVNSVGKNVLLEYYRKLTREQHADLDAADGPDGNADLEAQTIAEENSQRVRATLDQLPRRHRAVLRAVLLDRDKDEVCRELGITREYLRVLMHRAAESFRDLYPEKGSNGADKNKNKGKDKNKK